MKMDMNTSPLARTHFAFDIFQKPLLNSGHTYSQCKMDLPVNFSTRPSEHITLLLTIKFRKSHNKQMCTTST